MTYEQYLKFKHWCPQRKVDGNMARPIWFSIIHAASALMEELNNYNGDHKAYKV